MGKRTRPRRGSLQFQPRSRAKSPIPRIRTWPSKEGAKLLGFAGYKVGLTHIIYTENDPRLGRRVGADKRLAITIVEVPPLRIIGYRFYKNSKAIGEVLAKELPKELSRRIKLPGKKESNKGKAKPQPVDFWKKSATNVRLIVCTQPKLSGLSKKKPEIMEMAIQGKVEDQLKTAEEFLGKDVQAKDVFKNGDYIDVFAVTTGKGFQGAVQRHGVKILSHKAKRGRREPGNIGAWTPKRTDWRTPMAGQMGYNQRCEYNKKILVMGEGGLNPKQGGWQGYGKLNGDYLFIAGSIPGPTKRLIRMRFPLRPPAKVFESPSITYIHIKGEAK